MRTRPSLGAVGSAATGGSARGESCRWAPAALAGWIAPVKIGLAAGRREPPSRFPVPATMALSAVRTWVTSTTGKRMERCRGAAGRALLSGRGAGRSEATGRLKNTASASAMPKPGRALISMVLSFPVNRPGTPNRPARAAYTGGGKAEACASNECAICSRQKNCLAVNCPGGLGSFKKLPDK